MNSHAAMIVQALDEIDRCLEVLDIASVALRAPDLLAGDLDTLSKVVYFAGERIVIAQGKIRQATR